MTLEFNNGSTKEIDSKAKFNPWPAVLGILLFMSFGLNVSQSIKINLLEKQVKASESLIELYKSGPAKPTEEVKPKFKMFVKVTPKVVNAVKPKEVVEIKKVTKLVYKEYTPLISNNETLLYKINEIQESINNLLNREFDVLYAAEGDKQLQHEKQLIDNLNNDLNILLDIRPENKEIKLFASPSTKTKKQILIDYAKKAAIPIALALIF